MQKLNVEFVVQTGLGVILVILFLLAITGMYEIRETNRSMSNLVHENQLKVELAHEMRDAIRLREIDLNKMLATDDPFERDALLIHFYENAGIYRKAREKLLDLPIDEQEKKIYNELTKVIRVAQPLNRKVAELIAANSPHTQTMDAVRAGSTQQQIVLTLLNQLVEIQNLRAHDAVSMGTKKYDQSLLLVIMFGVIAIIGALFIVRRVSKYVAGKNRQLAEASEGALSANKTKSAFLATMSHEIRTPLTAIIGFAEASLDSDQTLHERISGTKTIIRNGRHLLQIINDILDLSKIEANKLELEQMELSPFVLLADVETIIKPLADSKGLTFKIEYEFPIPKMIVSDSLRLKQIIINLLSNAVKFTQTGHVIIQVKFDKQNRNIVFTVIDSGIGMTEAQLAKIFEAFNQADSSTTRKYGGTGLGLSLSKELAQHLGGDITVRSLIHTGSQFQLIVNAGNDIEFEYVWDGNEIPNTNQLSDKEVFSNKFNGKILLAEDNSDNQRLLSHCIKNLGVSISIADNGKIAISMANEEHYDLILMDMQMPVLNGLDAVRQLRETDYKKPIVALTANAMKQDKEKCITAGCDDFLTKPIDRKELYRIVAKYLQQDDSYKGAGYKIVSTLVGDDPEMADLVENYCANLAGIYQHIQILHSDENWPELKNVIHQLKGTGGGMGFQILTEVAGKIDFQIANEDYLSVGILISELGEVVKCIIPTQVHGDKITTTPTLDKIPRRGLSGY